MTSWRLNERGQQRWGYNKRNWNQATRQHDSHFTKLKNNTFINMFYRDLFSFGFPGTSSFLSGFLRRRRLISITSWWRHSGAIVIIIGVGGCWCGCRWRNRGWGWGYQGPTTHVQWLVVARERPHLQLDALEWQVGLHQPDHSLYEWRVVYIQQKHIIIIIIIIIIVI